MYGIYAYIDPETTPIYLNMPVPLECLGFRTSEVGDLHFHPLRAAVDLSRPSGGELLGLAEGWHRRPGSRSEEPTLGAQARDELDLN